MINLQKLTIKEARSALDAKEYSAVDLAAAYLEQIKKVNTDINAYLEIYSDVLEQAKNADVRLAKGESTPLLGIPLAIKDNILISGKIASASSKMLENYKATYDATAISKLKEMGAVFLGRANMDEFAMGGSTENSAFGVTKNPVDPTRVSGGSSGGSAAAVAMHGALGALGSDTGGSVRQPASFCGVVGLKPTYGSVSRHGLMAMGSSLDVIGPIGNSVDDVEIIFNAIKGVDPLDSTTYKNDTYKHRSSDGKTIGVPWSILDTPGIEESVKENFKASVEKFKSLGYKIVDVSLPNIHFGLAVYYILMPAEVSSNMARFDGVKYGLHVDGEKGLLSDYLRTRHEGFGLEVRRRIILGTYVLSSGYHDAFYGKAQIVRGLIKSDFAKAFESVDAILTPTTPASAFKIGEKSDPLSLYLADIFTVTANIAGIPAISVPSGITNVDGKNLPLGIQIMADFDREDVLFSVGRDFQNK